MKHFATLVLHCYKATNNSDFWEKQNISVSSQIQGILSPTISLYPFKTSWKTDNRVIQNLPLLFNNAPIWQNSDSSIWNKMCNGDWIWIFFGASTTGSRLNLFVSFSCNHCHSKLSVRLLFSRSHRYSADPHCKATKISFCQKRSSAFEVLTNVSPLSCHRPQSGAQS